MSTSLGTGPLGTGPLETGSLGTGTAVPASSLRTMLDAIVALSHRFGENPEFVRGGGGNSSVKDGGILYIKASGTTLATLTPETMIALRIEPLLELLESPPGTEGGAGSDAVMSVALRSRVGEDDGRRPSVECLFHAMLPERYVLHTHPTLVNVLGCLRGGDAVAERLFGDAVVWVPYTDPGLPLARAIAAARKSHAERAGGPPPRVMLLQNHGLVIAADSVDEIEAASTRLVETIRSNLAGGAEPEWGSTERLEESSASAALRAAGPFLRGLLSTSDRLKIVTFDDSPLAIAAGGSALGRRLVAGGPLTPDQIVYAGSYPLVLPPGSATQPDRLAGALRAALDERRATGAPDPIIVLVPGLGLFAAADTFAQADLAREVYVDALRISVDAERIGAVRPLSEVERTFIERWEAEEYRRRVAAGSPSEGRARGIVAVVTGAAQGFGQAIAADLVAEGGHVVLADVNVELASREADRLTAEHGQGRAVGVAVDVTDDASVARCLEQVVRLFGGLDLLVSNAGILRAGSVASQPVEEFDAVTRVNYRGYYLCVRNAAPILARQHEARPDYWSDVVEINSKSGLEGSSRNSAYAGSKFGGIGLTQSFALELVGDGIKVNAVCPGNFLDGPLWSDPDRGLFVQYLREGKVPGAATLDDVRRFYESKVPMGRGCTPADVLEALYYVVAQRYETGQAIPVTGGQVMLS